MNFLIPQINNCEMSASIVMYGIGASIYKVHAHTLFNWYALEHTSLLVFQMIDTHEYSVAPCTYTTHAAVTGRGGVGSGGAVCGREVVWVQTE